MRRGNNRCYRDTKIEESTRRFVGKTKRGNKKENIQTELDQVDK